jgi:hypothetical protein
MSRWSFVGSLLIGGLLLPTPASGTTLGGAPIAVPDGPCRSGVSVPLSGLYNQIYTCVGDRWVASDLLGSTGATGPAGPQGPSACS